MASVDNPSLHSDSISSHSAAMSQSEGVSLLKRYLDEDCLTYLYAKNPHQSPTETRQQTEECLRYLYLSGFVHGSVPISREVDHIWHLLILETKYYLALCQRLPGGYFRHHSSHDFPNKTRLAKTRLVVPDPSLRQRSGSSEASRNLSWLLSYVANFGDFTLDTIRYWPYAIGILQQLNLNICDFNKKLRDLSGKRYP